MKGPGLHMWVVCEHIAQDMDFVVILYLDSLKVTVPLTGATPAKNTADAAGALRNALTACNTLEGTKRFSGAVWISARNGQRTS